MCLSILFLIFSSSSSSFKAATPLECLQVTRIPRHRCCRKIFWLELFMPFSCYSIFIHIYIFFVLFYFILFSWGSSLSSSVVMCDFVSLFLPFFLSLMYVLLFPSPLPRPAFPTILPCHIRPSLPSSPLPHPACLPYRPC